MSEPGSPTPTPLASMAMFLAASLFGALGQYLYKSGADQAEGGLLSFLNPRILAGVAQSLRQLNGPEIGCIRFFHPAIFSLRDTAGALGVDRLGARQ